MNLDTVIFQNITLGQLAAWTLAAVALYGIIKFYRALFVKKKTNLQHTVYFVCTHCGWEGHISKFGTRCPKCNAPAENHDTGGQ